METAVGIGIATTTSHIVTIFGNTMAIVGVYLGFFVGLGYAIHLVRKYIGKGV